MEKQNDYFLNQLYNPGFSPGDFVNLGINTSNTSLQNKDVYKNLDAVRNNPALQTNGEFDGVKFDQMYAKALAGYNQIAQAKSNDDLASSMAAFKENIFAKPEQRTLNNNNSTYVTRILNPNRQTGGFGTWGSYEEPTMSSKEVAESNKTYNPNTGIWEESPNDRGAIGTLLDILNPSRGPKVLDTWEEDGTHTDFWTGEKIKHHKGELKLGPGGEYQYRSLKKGEDIYGKDVLHATDVLTTDGSVANKYDFFDSDDLDQSTGKSLLRAAVKIVPAFIPGVNTWYLGTRVALNAADLFAKLGKMTLGTDQPSSDFFTRLEAFNQSTSFGQSAYSTGDQGIGTVGHSWSLENLIGLASDVFTQLGEQRWLFTQFPSWYKGVNPAIFKNGKKGEEALNAMQKEEVLKFGEDDFLKTVDLKNITPKELTDLFKAESFAYANAQIQSKMEDVQKLGASISKLYMTGITVADSYGEAKNQGLSDAEAALFTLGYATAEYGLLSTELGEHILPELKIQKQQMKSIARTLSGIKQDVDSKNLPTKKWYERIFNFGKEVATGNYSNATVKSKALTVAAHALGEGTEEVSEEMLLDFSKALFNIQQSIRNRPTMETFNGGDVGQVLDRYAQNFIGGLLGGGIATQLPGFREQWKKLNITDNSQAWQEFVALIRNGKKDEFLSTVNKMTLGSDVLSAKSSDGTTGDEEDNIDTQMKANLKNVADFVDDFISSEGAKYSDDTILTKLVGMDKNLKFAALKNSIISGKYLQDYNTLVTDIVNQKSIIRDLTTNNTDHRVQLTTEQEQNLKKAQTKLQEDQQILQQYNDGTRFKDYVRHALFELNPAISSPYTDNNFDSFVKRVEGKPLNEVNPKRLKELHKTWDDYSQLDRADQIMAAYDIFEAVNQRTSDLIKQHVDEYIANKNNALDASEQIDRSLKVGFINEAEQSPDTALELISRYQKFSNIQGKGSRANTLTSYLLHAIDGSDINVDYLFEPNENDPENPYEPPFDESIIAPLRGKGLSNLIKFIDSLPLNVEELQEHPELSAYYQGRETDAEVAEATETYKEDLLNGIFRNAKTLQKINNFLKNNISYLSNDTRNYLRNMFNYIDNRNAAMQYGEEAKQIEQEWDNIRDTIANKKFTPIETLLDNFIIKNGEDTIKVTDLLNILNSRLQDSVNKGNIGSFSFNDNLQSALQDAIRWCDILQAHIIAAENNGKSVGNYGYNVTLNEIDPESKLATIDKNSAQLILNDLYKVRTQLHYYDTIFRVNTNQKLKVHNEIRAKFDVYKWERLHNLLNEDFPDDWKGKDELISTLESCAAIKSLRDNTDEKKYQVDQETQAKIFEESVKIQDALYKFFQDNKSKIDDGTLTTILKNKLDFIGRNDNEVKVDATSPSDRTFFWWLVSNIAVKSSDFYANYKNILVGDFAPIPGQEEAVKMAYSFLTNRGIFKQFAKIYNEVVKDNIKELKDSDYTNINSNLMINLAKDSGDDNDVTLQIVNTILLEGIPGSGKSTGFYITLLRLLNKYHSNELSKGKIWLVHINKEKAEKLAKEIANVTGLSEDQFECMGKDDYLKKINEKYTPQLLKEDGTLKTDVSSLKRDDNTQLYHYKEESINTSINPAPSLVIMDEVTRFSQQDMLLSDKFQEEYGVAGIATGDFDQLGAIGTFQTGTSNNSDIISLSLFRNNFIGGIRLGTSMRTSNLIKDYNIQDARSKMYDLIHTLVTDVPKDEMKINLSYYQNNDKTSDNYGLYGDKLETFGDNFKQDIILMLDSLKEGETVNFIASDINSDLYKYIKQLTTSSEYKDKIRIVNSSDVQGDEAQYYIAELPNVGISDSANNSEKLSYYQFKVKQFYTAISRAKQATLIVDNISTNNIATCSRVKNPDISSLSKKGIENYTNQTKEMFNKVITNEDGKVKFIPLTQKQTPAHTTTTVEEPPKNDFEGEKAPIKKGITSIDNEEEGVFNMLTYDMPVNETGGYRVDNPNSSIGYDIKPGLNSKDRIDGVNGMMKIVGESRKPNAEIDANGNIIDPETVLHKLSTIRSAGLFCKDKSEIIEEVKRQLDIRNQDIGVDFVYIQKPVQNDDNPDLGEKKHNSKRFIRFIKDSAEYVMGIFKGGNESKRTKQSERDKYIEMIVYTKGKSNEGKELRTNILEVPLLIFTSPLTMLETKGFEQLKDAYYKGYAGQKDSLINFLQYLQNTDEGKSLPNSQNMVKLLKLYTRKGMEGDFVYYFDDDFTLAKNATYITGPYLINHDKGSKYIYNQEDFGYEGDWTSLDQLDKGTYKHSKVYALEQDELDDDGNLIAKAGTYFMIVSTKFDNLDDEGMIRAYKAQKGKGGPYNMIFVDTPKVSITDYFQNAEYLRMRKGDGDFSIDKHLGNMLTTFRLAQAFAKDESHFDKRYQEIKKNFYDKNNKSLQEIDDEWNLFKKVIGFINQKINDGKWTPVALLDYLKNPADEELLQFVKDNIGEGKLYDRFKNTKSLTKYINALVLKFGNDIRANILGPARPDVEDNIPKFDSSVLENHKYIEQDVKETYSNNFDGIFVRGINNGNDIAIDGNNYRGIECDNNMHMVSGGKDYGSFTTNGKIDLASMIFDIFGMISSINDSIDKGNEKGTKWAYDLVRYTRNNWVVNDDENPNEESISYNDLINLFINPNKVTNLIKSKSYKDWINSHPNTKELDITKDVNLFLKILDDLRIPTFFSNGKFDIFGTNENILKEYRDSNYIILDGNSSGVYQIDNKGTLVNISLEDYESTLSQDELLWLKDNYKSYQDNPNSIQFASTKQKEQMEIYDFLQKHKPSEPPTNEFSIDNLKLSEDQLSLFAQVFTDNNISALEENDDFKDWIKETMDATNEAKQLGDDSIVPEVISGAINNIDDRLGNIMTQEQKDELITSLINYFDTLEFKDNNEDSITGCSIPNKPF